MPQRPAPGDVVLLCVATHKLSRLLAKDAITSPLRAPFTRYDRPIGSGEVMEQVRDEGSATRHAFGELLSCPFCLAVWVATGLTGGLVLAPRLTRLVATALTAVAASDFLQMGYAAAQRAAENGERGNRPGIGAGARGPWSVRASGGPGAVVLAGPTARRLGLTFVFVLAGDDLVRDRRLLAFPGEVRVGIRVRRGRRLAERLDVVLLPLAALGHPSVLSSVPPRLGLLRPRGRWF